MKGATPFNPAIRSPMLYFAAILLAVIAIPVNEAHTHAAMPETEFTASRQSIHLGESVELSWTIVGSEKGFLSYIGAVKNKGSSLVRPEYTTTYELLADTPSGLFARHLTVEVIGGRRGDDFVLNAEAFIHPVNATTEIGFADLAVQVNSVLQNEMHLSVKKVEYNPDQVRLVFVTSQATDQSLVKPNEPKIGARRVAYLVTIERGIKVGTLDYTVKTCVEYRLRIEETWRPEPSEDAYGSLGGNLLSRIENSVKFRQSTE